MSSECCYHCKDQLVPNEVILHDDKKFCCTGCKTVYNILSGKGLSEYYELKDTNTNGKPAYDNSAYAFLDHPDFIEEYINDNSETVKIRFYVEGIHCTACLWLLEKLPDLLDGVVDSHLNMSTSTLTIECTKELKLSAVAQKISTIGYTPHVILDGEDHLIHAQKENKKSLIRIGTAFACAGNIMLYSLAVYFGAPKEFSDYFNLFSFLCTIPIVFFCAVPFYTSAIGSLKTKQLSIDIPIVIVILLSFITGGVSLFTRFELYYFDTISTLVFLLLLARYILRTIQKRTLGSENVTSQYFNYLAIRKKNNGDEEEILAKYIKLGDEIVVKAGAMIPVDGVVLAGNSFVNNSILSGESEPIQVKSGGEVFMGAYNLDSRLIIEASSATSETRMGKILSEVESQWNSKTHIAGLIDIVSKYFTISVLSLSVFFFIYFLYFYNLEIAFERSFSLLLITCPCALALSTPLAFILGLGAMLKKGVFVKNEQVIEKLIHAKEVFLDKTGTITDGNFKVDLSKVDSNDYKYLYALEARSNHPIAKSICKLLNIKDLDSIPIIIDYKETPGKGVSGIIESSLYEIKSTIENEAIGLYRDSKLIGILEVQDHIREGALETISKLKDRGVTPYILSGDNKEKVLFTAAQIGIDPDHIFFEVSPEEKMEIVKNHPMSIMVGDGINDASAIKNAYVGIAVHGSAEVSLKASDIYLSKSGVEHITNLILTAHAIFSIIKRNLSFSIIYNIVGIYLAFTGLVSPLLAAIFMPLSSLTVFISTLISINKLKKTMR